MSKPSRLRRFLRRYGTALPGSGWRCRISCSCCLLPVYFVYLGGGTEPPPEPRCCSISPARSSTRSRRWSRWRRCSPSLPESHEVLLRDVIDAINFAAADPAVNSLVMELDELDYVGLSKTQEIAVALEAFKASGKPVVAVGDFYTQDQFLLASFADNIIVNPWAGLASRIQQLPQLFPRDAGEAVSQHACVSRRRVQVHCRALPAGRYVARRETRLPGAGSRCCGDSTRPRWKPSASCLPAV